MIAPRYSGVLTASAYCLSEPRRPSFRRLGPTRRPGPPSGVDRVRRAYLPSPIVGCRARLRAGSLRVRCPSGIPLGRRGPVRSIGRLSPHEMS
jgi:hypothetical protein